MKKIAGIIAKSLLGLVLLILILLFTVPIIFKNKIKTKVEQVIDGSVNAKVKFADYKLGFFHNFPNLSFGMKDVSVVGVDKFAGDTLAGFKSFDLVFNLASLFGKSGYEVKSIIVDQGVINVIYLKDGSANYDIMKPSTGTAAPAAPAATAASTSSSGLRILLKKVMVRNSSVSYVDLGSDMAAYLKKLNISLKGDMTASQTDLQISLNSGDLTFIMDKVKYINKAVLDSKIDMLADLDKMKFTFRDNYILLNDLMLKFTGSVAMPANDIITDLNFSTEKASFKSLLSLVPAVYMADFK
ncbi:MAG: AsmA family protein, partial [Bacteroidales bacterium]